MSEQILWQRKSSIKWFKCLGTYYHVTPFETLEAELFHVPGKKNEKTHLFNRDTCTFKIEQGNTIISSNVKFENILFVIYENEIISNMLRCKISSYSGFYELDGKNAFLEEDLDTPYLQDLWERTFDRFWSLAVERQEVQSLGSSSYKFSKEIVEPEHKRITGTQK